jgi:hypothetical protein
VKKTIGQLLIFTGIVAAIDLTHFGGIGGAAGAGLGIVLILFGMKLIRESNRKA